MNWWLAFWVADTLIFGGLGFYWWHTNDKSSAVIDWCFALVGLAMVITEVVRLG